MKTLQVDVTAIQLPGLLDGRASLRYRVYKEEKPAVVCLNADQNDEKLDNLRLSHSRRIAFKKVTTGHLTFLEKDYIAFLLYVDQGDTQVFIKQFSYFPFILHTEMRGFII